MRYLSGQTGQLKDSTGIGALLLTVFAAELAVTELLSPLFARLSLVSGALLDAAIIVLISAFPLWLFFARPVPEPREDPSRDRPAHGVI